MARVYHNLCPGASAAQIWRSAGSGQIRSVTSCNVSTLLTEGLPNKSHGLSRFSRVRQMIPTIATSSWRAISFRYAVPFSMSFTEIQGSSPCITFGNHSCRASATCRLLSRDQLRKIFIVYLSNREIIWTIGNARRLKFGYDCLPLSGRR
jgi:hypothetical protein